MQPGDPVLPERLRHLKLNQELSTAGLVDIDVETRPDWSKVERALWEAAVGLDPAGDLAIADLAEEARELLPLTTSLRRVLATARTPTTTEG